MKINPIEGEENLYTVEFEVVGDYEFHEKVVAVNALSSLVRSRVNDQLYGWRPQPSELALQLNNLKHVEDEKKVPVDTKLQMNAIVALSMGLHDFIKTRDQDIHAASLGGNLLACSVRDVETLMAGDMLAVIQKLHDYDEPTWETQRRVGFLLEPQPSESVIQ